MRSIALVLAAAAKPSLAATYQLGPGSAVPRPLQFPPSIGAVTEPVDVIFFDGFERGL